MAIKRELKMRQLVIRAHKTEAATLALPMPRTRLSLVFLRLRQKLFSSLLPH